ncbi:pyridoxamine 5'-phosphate oxidase family protein [Dyadobacter sp. CY261]|uniref:pyridoxamine 5'-phosphate oxidase family protein n=1 Tax=Dyadobacter sp. CY261 TaxID=2907203 RepID=UPI001F404E76|nr:pyridoxamine 5'-phosphate oxidase family protein [Dyadobacter sp. CY261]MCF0069571.1 pyridoxamine 5'-phosphate oxidase family protein [Dyadobacter sp. CY261]
MPDSVFHTGELYVQRNAGEEHFAMQNGSIVRNVIAGGAANFVSEQQFFFAASQDTEGNVWASVLSGAPGFVQLTDMHSLLFDPDLRNSNADDIFWKNIHEDATIGLLFIELTTRRRFRVNGRIYPQGSLWRLEVEQAYPNCPKYIQRRELVHEDVVGPSIGQDLRKWIDQADTFFVASSDSEGNLDASHRGGNPGFVKWVRTDVVRVPDYQGNSMFNTLGNFYENPKAGLLFVDFSNGETLKMSGKVQLHLHEESAADFTGGTDRFWDFKIEKVVFEKSLENFTMRLIDFSRFNP